MTGVLPPDFPFAVPVQSVQANFHAQANFTAPPAPGGTLGGGVGTLGFVVWPTHAGAVQSNGQEPMFGLDYKRGQIYWAVNELGDLRGRATIDVPAGEWAWIIYTHNPLTPGFVTAQKLAHPIILAEAGTIDLTEITEDEVRPMNPDPVLRD